MGYYVARAKTVLREAIQSHRRAQFAVRAAATHIEVAKKKVKAEAKREDRDLAREKRRAEKVRARLKRKRKIQRAAERRARLKAVAEKRAASRLWKRGEPFEAPAAIKHMPPVGVAFIGYKQVEVWRGDNTIGVAILKLLVDAKTRRVQSRPDGICRVAKANVLEICASKSWETYDKRCHRLISNYDSGFEYKVGRVAVAKPGFSVDGDAGIYLHLHKAAAQ